MTSRSTSFGIVFTHISLNTDRMLHRPDLSGPTLGGSEFEPFSTGRPIMKTLTVAERSDNAKLEMPSWDTSAIDGVVPCLFGIARQAARSSQPIWICCRLP